MQNLFAMAGHFVVVLADNTLGAEADQESIHDFVVGVTVFGAKLLAGVVFNLWTPATTWSFVSVTTNEGKTKYVQSQKWQSLSSTLALLIPPW